MGEVKLSATTRTETSTSIERKKGSDCTGNSGTTNRTLVLTNTPSNLLVFLNGQLLTLTEDYTLATDTITFLLVIDNSDFITAHYET